jgi:hypothetical protein
MWAALSVIAIILPSEKSRKAVGTGLKRAKPLGLLIPGAFGYRNKRTRHPPYAVPLHPIFTVCRA